MRISDWSSDVCSSDLQFGLLRGRIATDQIRTARIIERFERASLGHAVEVVRSRGTPLMRGLDFEEGAECLVHRHRSFAVAGKAGNQRARARQRVVEGKGV